ncbi:RNA polymerase sigma-70 factor (ECF subfamily) [Dyella sp. SG562]|uniref:RNA polymerase sigma-70 factor n=1 Tax=Dyella sp. SG562 TaxID=2587017 RepID=UPI00141F4784|nr:RNA polymerase sigma-70 factor [Dyella sp. SG562]NII74501.1 RNA polymerase sigma-70 factor (ECF subfamily) [Dyella sp. SG562]
MATNDLNAVFHGLRPRLQGIAYGMLGSVADAEDVVQDVWLRWHAAEQSRIGNLEAWLVTATTRAAIDRLRALKARREHYVGMWLPEPMLTDAADTPEQLQERSSEVSVALLLLLERLSPEARAAFLLREVFDVGYPEIAGIIDKNEAGVRQIVHRAKTHLQDGRPRYAVSAESHLRIVRRFAQATAEGEFKLLTALLADDAELIGDGGGRTTSLPRPMPGGKRIAQLLYAGKLRFKGELGIDVVEVNGRLAILRSIGGKLESVMMVETDGERVTDMFVQRNPEKLAGVAQKLGLELWTPL